MTLNISYDALIKGIDTANYYKHEIPRKVYLFSRETWLASE